MCMSTHSSDDTLPIFALFFYQVVFGDEGHNALDALSYMISPGNFEHLTEFAKVLPLLNGKKVRSLSSAK